VLSLPGNISILTTYYSFTIGINSIASYIDTFLFGLNLIVLYIVTFLNTTVVVLRIYV